MSAYFVFNYSITTYRILFHLNYLTYLTYLWLPPEFITGRRKRRKLTRKRRLFSIAGKNFDMLVWLSYWQVLPIISNKWISILSPFLSGCGTHQLQPMGHIERNGNSVKFQSSPVFSGVGDKVRLSTSRLEQNDRSVHEYCSELQNKQSAPFSAVLLLWSPRAYWRANLGGRDT